MDNFIEESIDYLFYNGGFDLIVGPQKFEFRIRPNNQIEVTSITNHIKKIYTGTPAVYQFFAFLVFCDLYSGKSKSVITLCKDKNVSRNNIKVINQIYEIYKSMLSISDKEMVDAVSNDDPAYIDGLMLDTAYENEFTNPSKLKYETIKARIESYAADFMRRYEYWDNLYDEFLTTEEYDLLHEYTQIKMEEAKAGICAKHPNYFSFQDVWEILFDRCNVLEESLETTFKDGFIEKHRIIEILMTLFDKQIDVLDIIEIIKNAFQVAINNEKDEVDYNDFIEAIGLSYLEDSIINELRERLSRDNNKVFVIKPNK